MYVNTQNERGSAILEVRITEIETFTCIDETSLKTGVETSVTKLIGLSLGLLAKHVQSKDNYKRKFRESG